MSDHVSGQTNASHQSPDWDAIARFLANESPIAEAERVRAWLAANPGDRELVEQLAAAAVLPLAEVDVESALRRVHSRMDERAAAPRITLVRNEVSWWRRSFVIPTILAAAAVLAVVVVRQSPTTSGPALAAQTYVTAVGKRDSITLSDGSRVILGPDSRLVVGADFGHDARSVELRGDGYFDVKHDPSKPFSVRVGNAIVEDLGTTFAVESDAGDTMNVAVLSGSVRLRPSSSAPNSGAVLAAGDRGSMSADGQVRSYPKSVTEDAAAWTSGRLVFRDASLARVAGEIRRWYGVNLRIADTNLTDRHVTATFNGEPVDQVLKIIGLTLGARIERVGDSATVTSIRGSTTTR